MKSKPEPPSPKPKKNNNKRSKSLALSLTSPETPKKLPLKGKAVTRTVGMSTRYQKAIASEIVKVLGVEEKNTDELPTPHQGGGGIGQFYSFSQLRIHSFRLITH
jgi:hypothetical protein